MTIKSLFILGLFTSCFLFGTGDLYANDSYLQTPEASERIKKAFEKGGIPMMQAEKFMLALSLSEQQREKVEPIFLTTIKKRKKAMKKLKGMNGRPQDAIEDLKKIQRKEKNKLKKILNSKQFKTYSAIVAVNKGFVNGLGNMRIPMVQGGVGGGYGNQSPTAQRP